MSGLILSDVGIVRSGQTIVSGANLSVPSGSMTALAGPNGAGKSTLLGAIVGLNPISTGSVIFEGTGLPDMDRLSRARLCAYVEQAVSTEERVRVADVVGLGRLPHASIWRATPTGEDEAAVADALNRVGMGAFAGRQFTTLSGGEQQRVHIARALAQKPRLLVLDEPTSHLDIRAQLQVLELLRDFADAGGTVILALHDLNLALRYCDRLAVMVGGHIMVEGKPEQVLSPQVLADAYGVRGRVVTTQAGAILAYDGII